ncbi:hypothetical protein D3C85_845890 [compost metagenome]
MEWHRAVGLGMDKLAHERIGRGTQRVRLALGRDPAVGDEIDVVGNQKRLLHIMGDDDRGGAQRVVEAADQVGGEAERDRVKASERLVIH